MSCPPVPKRQASSFPLALQSINVWLPWIPVNVCGRGSDSTYVGDHQGEQVLHQTLIHETGHFKMDARLSGRGRQHVRQLGEESFSLRC